MKHVHSEIDARPVARHAALVSLVAATVLVSACAGQSSTLAGRSGAAGGTRPGATAGNVAKPAVASESKGASTSTTGAPSASKTGGATDRSAAGGATVGVGNIDAPRGKNSVGTSPKAGVTVADVKIADVPAAGRGDRAADARAGVSPSGAGAGPRAEAGDGGASGTSAAGAASGAGGTDGAVGTDGAGGAAGTAGNRAAGADTAGADGATGESNGASGATAGSRSGTGAAGTAGVPNAAARASTADGAAGANAANGSSGSAASTGAGSDATRSGAANATTGAGGAAGGSVSGAASAATAGTGAAGSSVGASRTAGTSGDTDAAAAADPGAGVAGTSRPMSADPMASRRAAGAAIAGAAGSAGSDDADAVRFPDGTSSHAGEAEASGSERGASGDTVAMIDDQRSRADGGAEGSAGPGSDAVDAARNAAELALQAERAAAASRRGRVDAPGKHVDIGEDEKLETLGGMLPMAIGMDERGLFDFDQYLLRDDVKATLDVLAEKLNAAVYDRLVIYGYADRLGTAQYNKSLSEKRAWAVAGYLMDHGVPPHKLKVEGRGEQDPVTAVDACEGLSRAEQIECFQRDRRVEITATVKQYSLNVK